MQLTTGDLSRMTGIAQQTLISWDRSEVLCASSRPGHRTDARAPRRYERDALIAALFAQAVSRMGFKGDDFRQMVSLVHEGGTRSLKRALLFTYTSGIPGLMTHIFSPESSADDQRWIEHLREEDALIGQPVSLHEIREHFSALIPGLLRAHGERGA